MAITEKYVTTTGSEAWATNSEVAPSSIVEAAANAAEGERVNIKSGTYTLAANLAFPSVAGDGTLWRGYNSTIGDLDDPGRSAATGTLTTTNFPVLDGGTLYQCTIAGGALFQNLTFQTAENDYTIDLNNAAYGALIKNCLIKNTHATGTACGCIQGQNGEGVLLYGCDLSVASTGAGYYMVEMNQGCVYGCRLWHTGTPNATMAAIRADSSEGTTIVNNVIFNVGRGIMTAQVASAIGNTFFDCTTGLYLQQGGLFIDNVGYTFAGYAIDGTANGSAALLDNNAFGNESSGRNNLTDSEEQNAVDLSADPFTASGSEDFTLNNTAGGGAACRTASMIWST